MDTIAQLQAALSDRYAIDREIGAGGMATVYLARDIKHDRHVALKVLNPELGAVLGVERFLSEIKVTANLQHPNLLPLFDSGEAGGLLFYVMPFVDGESLRVKLDREKQFPVDEAIRIAVAVANALDYAHGHGVIHRDLKPENILLQAGQPVVADFGIALAVSKAGGQRITQTGLSLGTPQYMSPEQATGDRVIDARSDIYSLAAMAYEMLTGEPPHIGNTAQAIIARVLTDKPRSIRSTRSAVPEQVEATIERALEKLPADRFGTAHEFADALTGRAGAGVSRATAARTAAVQAEARSWRARVRDPLVAALALVAVAALGVAGYATSRTPAPVAARAVRFVLTVPDSVHLGEGPGPWSGAISPDGGTVAFWATAGSDQLSLWIRRSDQLESHPLPGTQGAFQPLFSPDGEWLGFERGGKFQKVRLDGSAPVAVSDGGSVNGADWTTRGEVILGADGKFHGLTRVSAAGGELAEFTHPDSARGETDHLWPIAAPDGENIVFVVYRGSLLSAQLAATNVRDGRVTPLGVKGIRPLAIVDDHLIYLQVDGAVMAAPFNARKRTLTDKPVPVHDPVGVYQELNGNSLVFVSAGGALLTSGGNAESQLSWIGKTGAVSFMSKEIRAFASPRLSPDESRIAVSIVEGPRSEVWMYNLVTGTLSRMSSAPSAWAPEWTPDGHTLLYFGATADGKTTAFAQAIDGGSAPRPVFETTDSPRDVAVSPDGRSLLYTTFRNNSWDIMQVSLDSSGPRKPREYLAMPSNETHPRFSPDGRWVAVSTDESGRTEVYVRSYPEPSVRLQVSVNGGGEPQWSRDGTRLLYRAGARVMAAKVNRIGGFSVVSRDTLAAPSTPLVGGGLGTSYDVSKDGARLLGLTSSKSSYHLVIVPNWVTEFRKLLAANAVK